MLHKMAVYETLRTWGGRFIFLNRHEARLGRSLKEIVAPYVGRNDVRLKIVVNDEVKITEEILPAWNGSFIYDRVWSLGFAGLERVQPEVKNADTFAKDLAETEQLIRAKVKDFDVVLMMGAGDIDDLARKLV